MAERQGLSKQPPRQIPGYYWDPAIQNYRIDTAGRSRWDAFWTDKGDQMSRGAGLDPTGSGIMRYPDQPKVDAMSLFSGWINGKPEDAKAGAGKTPPQSNWGFGGGQPAAAPSGPKGPAGYIFAPESGAAGQRAVNPRSSAKGSGQFLEDTWNDPDLKARAGYGNIDPRRWALLRYEDSPVGVMANEAMTNAYAARNSELYRKKFGKDPGPGDIYGMHFLDGAGWTRLMEVAAKNPSADASALFPQAAAANPTIFRANGGRPRTVSEVYQVVTSKVNAGQRDPNWTAPEYKQLDPAAMAALIPDPQRAPYLQLPNAVPRPIMGARPQQELIDVDKLTADMAAFAPKPFDQQAADKERFGKVLMGLAAGAFNSDPRLGVSNVLAGLGAGSSAALEGWKDQTKAEKKAAEEASRMFGLQTFETRTNAEQANRGTRFANKNAEWQDNTDKLMSDYMSKKDQWDIDFQEAVRNNQIDGQFVQDAYQAKLMRGRAQMDTIQFNTQMENQQLGQQAELDLKRFLWADEKATRLADEGLVKSGTALVRTVGIDPQLAYQTKDPVGMNATQGALYISAGNKPGAINALARELVLTGRTELITDPKIKAQITSLMKQDPEIAMAAIGRLLNEGENANPGSVLEWAKALAAGGNPFATLFVQQAQPQGQ